MGESEVVSQIIGGIYDAALDPERWPDALEKICAFVPGSMGNIFTQDAVNESAERIFTWGHDTHYMTLYVQKYVGLNPIFPSAMFIPVGDIYSVSDIMSHSELMATRYYREWLRPQGYLDFVACNLDKTATSAAVIAIIRRERDGIIDADARRRMGLVAPHVRRAILVGKTINLVKIKAAALADALDGLAAAVFIVGVEGRILHANAAALALVDRGGLLRTNGNKFAINDVRANATIQTALTAAAVGDMALGTKGIAVPLQLGEEPGYVAHVLPLASTSRRRASGSGAAVAAVFLHPTARDLQSPLEILSRRHRLTAGEVRVLLMLLNTGSVAATADALGISEGTVRNHLHHLYAKTGTKGQTELVNLVGQMVGPLR